MTVLFLQKKSMPSLIGGVGSGVLMAISGLLIGKDQEMAGHALGALTGTVIGSVMLKRSISTKKVMPAGAVAVLMGLTAAYNGVKFNDYYQIAQQEKLESAPVSK
jgi:uncharacterized membrane protein (UPF0136 family)